MSDLRQEKLKLWVAGDLDGFFGLFTNSLANTLTAIFLIAVVVFGGTQDSVVFGRIVPAIVLSLAFGNIYFAWMGWRLAKKEGRGNVTAVPYGLSVPHYFIVTIGVMLPIYAGNPENLMLAWGTGVAWCFVHAVVAFIGAFVGPTLRKLTPRAAMLGTLAGVAITYIALGAAFQSFSYAWMAMISMAVLFIGWLAKVKFPGNVPAGLVAVIIGTILGWIIPGVMNLADLQGAVATVGIAFPLLQLKVLATGLPLIIPYLISAVPLAIYLFMETLNNIESASVGGDEYNTREVMIAAAGGTLLASLFGSPYPTLVYIGHPGWKSIGARIGYSWGTGVALFLLGCLGLLNVLLKLIPIYAILPILIYIGMLITSQAFSESPKRHAPAIALAMIPWLADWTYGKIVLGIESAVGPANAAEVIAGLQGNPLYLQGMQTLGAGSILVGMIFAAITVFLIDRNYKGAIGYALFGAVCSFFGVIHATAFSINAAPGAMIGYLAFALISFLMFFYDKSAGDFVPTDD